MEFHFSSYILQENIMKYFKLHQFKEIAIGLNHGRQTTSESISSQSYGILV